MAKIYNDILETIGGTPLVRLNRLDKDLPGNVLVKLEFFNPANSVKDRIGKAIVAPSWRPPPATLVSPWPWWAPPAAIT